jgi:hypothetical protein
VRIIDYTADVRSIVLALAASLDCLLMRIRVSESAADVLVGTKDVVLNALTNVYLLRRVARLGARGIDDPSRIFQSAGGADAPTVRSSAPGKENWDFVPWLREKVGRVEEEIYAFLQICTEAQQQTHPPAWRKVFVADDPRLEAGRRLDGARRVLDDVLRLIDSGELKVQQFTSDD